MYVYHEILSSQDPPLYHLQVNHSHLFLLGSDRLCLNLCKVTTPTRTTGEAKGQATPAGTSAVSSPQWRVVQYPSSYMALNWPVKVGLA